MAGVLGPGSIPPPNSGNTQHAFVKNKVDPVKKATSDPLFYQVLQYDYQTWLEGPDPRLFGSRLNQQFGLKSDKAVAYLDPNRAYNPKNYNLAPWDSTPGAANPGWVQPGLNTDPNFTGGLSEEDLKPWTRGGTYDDSDLGPAQGNWDIPTSTSNFKRPRTVAAGYDRNQQLLTVVFRDGTFWNYYDVSNDEWIKFHQAYSKGPLLNKGGSIYENHRGDATDLSSMSPQAQQFFVAVARAAQITFRDSTPKRGQLTGSQPLRSKNKRIKAEYDRQRRARIKANQSAAASAAAGKNPSKNGKNPFKG